MSLLPTRQLGRNGPMVTALGFGAMGLSTAYSTPGDDVHRLNLLDRAYELGQTFWDSADMYGDTTKFGGLVTSEGGMGWKSSPEYCKMACDRSLQRLGISCIDLYYWHRVDADTPIEKTIEAMVELKNAGKIKYIGLSEVSSATLRRAHQVHPIAAVQMEYSPFCLELEATDFMETCRELGVAIVVYSPLGQGMLSGRYKSPDDFEPTDYRRMSARFSIENFPKNLELVEALGAIAQRKGCTSSQLALAWLLAQSSDIIPIPGTNKTKYFEENIASLDVVLSPEEIKEIRKVIDDAVVIGSRHLEGIDMRSYADTPPLTT